MHLLINLLCVIVICDRTQYLERESRGKASMCEWQIRSTQEETEMESSLYFPVEDACSGELDLTSENPQAEQIKGQLQKHLEKVIIPFQHEEGSPCACQSDGTWLFHYIKDESNNRDCSKRTCAELAIESMNPDMVKQRTCPKGQCPTPAGALLLTHHQFLREPIGVTWGTPCDAEAGQHPELFKEVKEDKTPEMVEAPNNEALIAVLKKIYELLEVTTQDLTALVALVPPGGGESNLDRVVESQLTEKTQKVLCIPYLNAFTTELKNDPKETPPSEFYFNGCNGAKSIVIWLTEQRRSEKVYKYIKDWISLKLDDTITECCKKISADEPDQEIDERLGDAETRCGFSETICQRFRIQTITFFGSEEEDRLEVDVENPEVPHNKLEGEGEYCVSNDDIPKYAVPILSPKKGSEIETLWGPDIDQAVRDRVSAKKIANDNTGIRIQKCGCCSKTDNKWTGSRYCANKDHPYGYTQKECTNLRRNVVVETPDEDTFVRRKTIVFERRFSDVSLGDLSLKSQTSEEDRIFFQDTLDTVDKDLGDIPVRIYKENAAHLQKMFDYMGLLRAFDCEIPALNDPIWTEKEASQPELKRLKEALHKEPKLLNLMKKLLKKGSKKCAKIGVCLPAFGYFTDIKTAAAQNQGSKLPPGTPIVAYEKCGCCALNGDAETGNFDPPTGTLNKCEAKKTKGYVPQACMRTKAFWKAAGYTKANEKAERYDEFAKLYKNINIAESKFDFSLKTWQAQKEKPKKENVFQKFTQTEIQSIKFEKLYDLWKEKEEFKNAIKQV